MTELSERIRRQVAVTIAYLADNKIDPHFAEVLMSHYLDFAREIEAEHPPSYDGSKSLGERLYEAVLAADRDAKAIPWRELDPGVQARMEKAALSFTARLSDAKEDNRASRSQPVSGAVGQDSDTGKVSG